MALRGLNAVLLDAHGTLVELEPPAPALRRVLAARFGVRMTDEQARRAIAAEIRYYRAHLAEGVDANSVGLLRGRCAEALRSGLAAERVLDSLGADELTSALLESLVFRPFPEVDGVLRRLRAAGLRLVVASNWDASLPETLARLGLLPLVDGVVCSAAVGAAKPDPRLFSRALEVAGVAACEAAHVGDSLTEDVAGARAAGLQPVLVSRGGAASASDGVPVISSLTELPAALGL